MTSPILKSTLHHSRWIVPCLLLLCGGGLTLGSHLSAADTSGLITAVATVGDIEETVLASGTLRPSKLVAVGAQVSGRIISLKVNLGDRVTKGALIAEIDSVTQRNDLRTAQASLANVRAQRVETEAELENAQVTLERQQSIFDRQAGAKADLDSAKATVKKNIAAIAAFDAQIVAAEVAVETAEAGLSYTHITAPTDGTVLAIVNQEGQTVNAAQSAPTIVILGQLDTMTVRAEISEADIVKVKVGQGVRFTILGAPADVQNAVLQTIEPAPQSITSDSAITASTSSTSTSSTSTSTSSSAIYYNGLFDVPNADGHFRAYMSAEVHIVLGAAHDVVTIPSSAISRASADGNAHVRLISATGAPLDHLVKIGLNDGVTAEVRSGIVAGDRVVIGEASRVATTPKMGGGPPPMGF